MSDTSKNGKKIKVGILFGGKSAEHEVSIQSAKNVLEALDKERFEPVLIGIDKQGKWRMNEQSALLMSSEDPRLAKLNASSSELTLLPGSTNRRLVSVSHEPTQALDVIFPILHGPMGEDGTIQGFLDLANVPYVGPGVLGSAIGMDKDVMKRLLREAGVPVTRLVTLHRRDRHSIDAGSLIEKLGLPLFVKPANMGSSVGVNKAENAEQLLKAIEHAFSYDRKILVEAAVIGDEVECSVLGNENPKASLPGRIIPQTDFYTYEAKYIDEHGAILEIPAKIPEPLTKKVQEVAIKAFQVLECEGMARIDMFVTKSGEVVLNEINTIPGFTKVSMYSQLWEASGLSYKDLITKLIELAIERFEERQKLRSSYFLDDSNEPERT
jgi:D-alanine-D-alanine ligase